LFQSFRSLFELRPKQFIQHILFKQFRLWGNQTPKNLREVPRAREQAATTSLALLFRHEMWYLCSVFSARHDLHHISMLLDPMFPESDAFIAPKDIEYFFAHKVS
jgi:hypothetical protein